jgi:glucuronoarabinoxylan endo-1,4-beta-xylanase
MSNQGAPLYAISLQNEPDVKVTYESCDWNASTMINFLKNNAPSIGVRIIAPESFNFNHSTCDSILNNNAAAANLSILGGHIYGGGIASHPLAASKGKEVWMTEYLINSPGSGPDMDTSMTGALQTAKSINDCMNVNMNAYIWWYTVRYYGPIDDGTKGGVSGSVTKKGYVMSQYAKFVRPGFTRVDVTDNNRYTQVDVTAYRQGTKIVLVVINRQTTAKSHIFTLWNGTVGTMIPYVTSSNKNCEQQNSISYKNGRFTYTLEPFSITTFVSN